MDAFEPRPFLIVLVTVILTTQVHFLFPEWTGEYDELIGPDQVPHHQLMESGWPLRSRTWWTRCTISHPDYLYSQPETTINTIFGLIVSLPINYIIWKKVPYWT